MKKLMLLAAVAALSACNQNEAEPAPGGERNRGSGRGGDDRRHGRYLRVHL